MAVKMIANLNPGDGDEPIEIKVIRKWTSFGKKSECCFIFIDKNGDAIQAGANLNDKNYFDSMIKVDTCYSLSNYICEKGKTFMITVPHKTGLRLGKAAKFQQIPSNDFPDYYFNFLEYDQLFLRLDNNKILTDYIGKIENVTDVLRRKGATFMKIKLENLSGTMIEATFWDDAALSFNKQVVTSLPSPVIAVVTSMKVGQYQGGLQLTATPASYIYINPEIDEAKAMAAGFVIRNDVTPVLNIQYEKFENLEIEKHRNRFTLAELLSQNPSRYMGAQFTCKAALTSIEESKGWFYKACDQCRKKLQPRGTTLACEDHEPVIKPKHLFSFTAMMADHTAEVKTTFFDNAATLLLEANCQTMIDELGYTDPKMLPVPLTNLKGKTKIFQIRFSKSSKPGAIDFVVDHVFEDVVLLEQEPQPKAQIIQQIATSTITTPMTPATIDLAIQDPNTPTLPPASSSQHTQTKRSHHSYARKEMKRKNAVSNLLGLLGFFCAWFFFVFTTFFQEN